MLNFWNINYLFINRIHFFYKKNNKKRKYFLMDDHRLSELIHIIPDRPSSWDHKRMKKFIEFIDLDKIVSKIGTFSFRV